MSTLYRASIYSEDGVLIDQVLDHTLSDVLTTIPRLYDGGRVIVHVVMRNATGSWDVVSTEMDFVLDNDPNERV